VIACTRIGTGRRHSNRFALVAGARGIVTVRARRAAHWRSLSRIATPLISFAKYSIELFAGIFANVGTSGVLVD
jgi:hypothetical protein